MSKRFLLNKPEHNGWIDRIGDICFAKPALSIDIETYSDPKYSSDPLEFALDPWRNRIRSVQITVPTGNWGVETSWLLDLHVITNIEPIRRVLAERRITKIIQNAMFETKNFMRHWNGTYPEGVFDTLIASQLFGLAGANMRHNLYWIAKRELGIELDKSEQTSNWRDELSETQIEYAFKDSEILIPLYCKLKDKLADAGMTRVAQIEFDAVLGFADIELYGMKGDMNVIRQISSALIERHANTRLAVKAQFPSSQVGLFEDEFGVESINIDSPMQLIKALNAKGYFPKDRKGKSSVKRGQLLAIRNKRNGAMIDGLIEYKGLNKLITSYCSPMESFVNPVTNKIHTGIRPIGQAQHRPSSGNPNIFQMPRGDKTQSYLPITFNEALSRIAKNRLIWTKKGSQSIYEQVAGDFLPTGDRFTPANLAQEFKDGKLIVTTQSGWQTEMLPLNFRHAFVPEFDDAVWSIADFANNQARVVADRAKVQSLIEGFNLGRDVYKQIASAVLQKPYEAVTKDDRQNAKVWVLAFFFGAGWQRFQEAVLDLARVEISERRARGDRTRFFSGLPELAQWHEDEPDFVRRNWYVETPYNRRIYFDPNRIDEETGMPKIPRNDAINFPICGTEVDGAKDAVGRIARWVRASGYDPAKYGLRIFVYDEIVCQVPRTNAEEFNAEQMRIMAECMQGVLATVPAKVDGGLGLTWADK